MGIIPGDDARYFYCRASVNLIPNLLNYFPTRGNVELVYCLKAVPGVGAACIDLQHCHGLAYAFEPFGERLVAARRAHIIVKLYAHEHLGTYAEGSLEKQGSCRRERTAAVEDVVKHLVRYSRLLRQRGLRQATAFYLLF